MGCFPVLMYHRLESAECPVVDPEEAPWSVTVDQFTSQLDHIRRTGRVGVAMDIVHARLTAGETIPGNWVAITFDDGNTSDHRHALPLLLERGFRATFFICGNRVDATGGLSAPTINEMAKAGMHIGSHAMTHRFLTSLGAREEEDELRDSRDLLASIVAAPVDHFAPPGGRWSGRTTDTLRRLSYRAVSTSAYGCNGASGARLAYRRLPVTRAVTASRFDAMVRGDRVRLFPGYVRAASLATARRLAGEALYARVRRSGGRP